MTSLNVWIHCRINKSSPRFLLDYQEEILREYASKNQYHVIGCSKDINDNLTTQKQILEKIVTYITHHKIDSLILYNLNTISYDPAVINDFMILCSYFHIQIIQTDP